MKANPQPVSACWHNYCAILNIAVLGNIFIIYQDFMTNKLNTGYALITGATSGIGYELCHLFASEKLPGKYMMS